MMGKIKVLFAMFMTIAFLLSLWIIPIVLAVKAYMSIETQWIRIAMYVVAAAWMFLVRPWTIFSDRNFPRFIEQIRRTITMLFD